MNPADGMETSRIISRISPFRTMGRLLLRMSDLQSNLLLCQMHVYLLVPAQHFLVKSSLTSLQSFSQRDSSICLSDKSFSAIRSHYPRREGTPGWSNQRTFCVHVLDSVLYNGGRDQQKHSLTIWHVLPWTLRLHQG